MQTGGPINWSRCCRGAHVLSHSSSSARRAGPLLVVLEGSGVRRTPRQPSRRTLLENTHAFKNWPRLHWECACHKVHQACTRVFQLHKSLLAALNSLSLVLTSPGVLPFLRLELDKIIAAQISLLPGRPALGTTALHFRQTVLTTFAPQSLSTSSACWCHQFGRVL